MKLSSYSLLALTFLSVPFFMGQASVSAKGGAGCGCSDAEPNALDEVLTQTEGPAPDAPDANDSNDTEGENVAGTDDECGGNLPGEGGACDSHDGDGRARAKTWEMEVVSYLGDPVNEECLGGCPVSLFKSPWTLTIRLDGTLLSSEKAFSFSFLKDEWKNKVMHLEVKRDASDPDGCPVEKQNPCWRTCSGECVDGDLPLKDSETLALDAKKLLAGYLKEVCNVALSLEDLEGPGLDEKIRRAVERISLKDTLQCAQGVFLTATQTVPLLEKALGRGLIQDETGKPYTSEQVFRCTKKMLLNGQASRPVPARRAP